MAKIIRGKVGGPEPDEGALTVGTLAERIKPIDPDVGGTIERIRHWVREGLLWPSSQHHAGTGKHRQFSESAVYDVAVLHVLTRAGLSISSQRYLADALTKVRYAVPKWRQARTQGRKYAPHLIVFWTAAGMAQFGVYEEGDDAKPAERAGFKASDVVLTFDFDLGKLFAKVEA
jgi:DNA-binding transcriptional MerR regulator